MPQKELEIVWNFRNSTPQKFYYERDKEKEKENK